MLAFVLHKTNKYKKENEEEHYFVFEKQTFLEHFDKEDNLSIISNCLITNYTEPETYNKQILDLYKKYNTDLFPHLKGEFSFGIWDKQKQTFFGGRDRVGVKPFYYYNDSDIFIYSSTLKYIKDYLGFTEIEDQWIFEALHGITTNKKTTQIKNIFKLLPSQYIKVNKKEIVIKKYWELKKKNINVKNKEEAILEFRKKLKNAISSRFFLNITATELSGGIDSATVTSITAITAKKRNSSIISFSFQLPDKSINKVFPFKDERKFANSLIEKYKNIELIQITNEDKSLINEINSQTEYFGIPIDYSLAFTYDEMLNIAKQKNIKIILTGAGGDEVVSNSCKYVIDELAINNNFIKLYKETNFKTTIKKILIHKLIKKISFLNKINNKRLVNKLPITHKLSNIILNDNIKNKYNYVLKKYINNRNSYFKSNNEYLKYKFEENYLAKRLDITGEIARKYSIEQSHPLLDIDLIEYFYSLPSNYLFEFKKERSFIKNSIKDLLPKLIYKRNNKGSSTVPHVQQSFLKDKSKIDNISIKTNNIFFKYIDLKRFKSNSEIISQRDFKNKKTKKRPNQLMFFTSLSLLHYFELQEK